MSTNRWISSGIAFHKERADEFLAVDMCLRNHGLFFVFQCAHHRTYLCKIEVTRCVVLKFRVAIIFNAKCSKIDKCLKNRAAQALFDGFDFLLDIRAVFAFCQRCENRLEGWERVGSGGLLAQTVQNHEQVRGAAFAADAEIGEDQFSFFAAGNGSWRRRLAEFFRPQCTLQIAFDVVHEIFQTDMFTDRADYAQYFVTVDGFGDIVMDTGFIGIADELFFRLGKA